MIKNFKKKSKHRTKKYQKTQSGTIKKEIIAKKNNVHYKEKRIYTINHLFEIKIRFRNDLKKNSINYSCKQTLIKSVTY